MKYYNIAVDLGSIYIPVKASSIDEAIQQAR